MMQISDLSKSPEVRKMLSGSNGVRRLARERPDWLLVVQACLEEAKETKGEFAGAWVLERAKKRGLSWFPNLRLLVSYGILKHEDTTRGGRRAYYTMPDPEGVERALRELEDLGKLNPKGWHLDA